MLVALFLRRIGAGGAPLDANNLHILLAVGAGQIMKKKKKKKEHTFTGETEARGRLLFFLFVFLAFSSCCGSILLAAEDKSIDDCLPRLVFVAGRTNWISRHNDHCLLLFSPSFSPSSSPFVPSSRSSSDVASSSPPFSSISSLSVSQKGSSKPCCWKEL